jgi:hypothetical protein
MTNDLICWLLRHIRALTSTSRWLLRKHSALLQATVKQRGTLAVPLLPFLFCLSRAGDLCLVLFFLQVWGSEAAQWRVLSAELRRCNEAEGGEGASLGWQNTGGYSYLCHPNEPFVAAIALNCWMFPTVYRSGAKY